MLNSASDIIKKKNDFLILLTFKYIKTLQYNDNKCPVD